MVPRDSGAPLDGVAGDLVESGHTVPTPVRGAQGLTATFGIVAVLKGEVVRDEERSKETMGAPIFGEYKASAWAFTWDWAKVVVA